MHELDVEQMLRRITPHQLKMWRAAYRGIPLGDSWRETDTICRTIHDANEKNIARRNAQKTDPADLSHEGDYIPYLKQIPRGKIRVDTASIEAHQRATERDYS